MGASTRVGLRVVVVTVWSAGVASEANDGGFRRAAGKDSYLDGGGGNSAQVVVKDFIRLSLVPLREE